jgi:hypothetical protein
MLPQAPLGCQDMFGTISDNIVAPVGKFGRQVRRNCSCGKLCCTGRQVWYNGRQLSFNYMQLREKE